MKTLIQKLDNKDAIIGIVGLGYVGLPLLLRYVEVGYRVIGFDIDANKLATLESGNSYISHIADTSVAAAIAGGLELSNDFSRAATADALILCVPTPLGKNREPDLSYVKGTLETLLPYLRAGQIMSLESTTYPGTTEEELLPPIESRGFHVGEDYFLVYSPEREDPGNTDYDTRSIPKLCGGCTPACLQTGLALYRQVIDRLVPVSSTRTAEMTKLLENIHRAVNIGLVNEMKIVADSMGIDIHEVIDAAATKPFGFTPYYPGPGPGGHCIPIDPFYLTWKARQCGIETRFIELAGEVNTTMPAWIIDKLAAALAARSRSLDGSRVLVLGLAYKPNVGDTRESPAVEMLQILQARGASIAYSDPYVPEFPVMRDYHFDLQSVALSADTIAGYDCVLIATHHDAFDYDLIRQHARLIIDTRGVYRETFDTLIKA